MRLSHLSDDQIRAALTQHDGSVRATADALNVGRTNFRHALQDRGLVTPTAARPRSNGRHPMPQLTRESLHRALEPPNNCKVKAFLDQLDPETLAVIDEALGYNNSDFPAAALRRWLVSEGYPDSIVPGEDAIKDHRAGRKPCRCR